MNGMSKFLEAAILSEKLSGVYIALYVTDPTDEDIGTEVNDSKYKRQSAEFSPPVSVGGSSYTINTNRIVFPIMGEGAGYVTHIGIRDAATGGNLLFHSPVFELINLDSGMGAKFEKSEIRITLG